MLNCRGKTAMLPRPAPTSPCSFREIGFSHWFAKYIASKIEALYSKLSLHGIQLAIGHFSKQLGVKVKPSLVQTWKGKYLAEISCKRKAGETCNPSMKSQHEVLACQKAWETFATWWRAEYWGLELHSSSAWRRWSDQYSHHYGSHYRYCKKSLQKPPGRKRRPNYCHE